MIRKTNVFDEGHDVIAVDNESRVATMSEKLNDSFFLAHTEHDVYSEATEHFETILDPGCKRMPHLTPEAFHTAGLRFLTYQRQPNFRALKACWWCRLAQTHHLIYRRGSEGNPLQLIGPVVATCEYYCIVWKLKLVSQRGRFHYLMTNPIVGTCC